MFGGDAVFVARVRFCSQFEARADGTWRDLNSLSANLPPSADASTSDELSKGLQGVDGGFCANVSELGVQVTVFAEFGPGTPITFPFFVRRLHESMLCGCVRSSEKTKELSLELKRNSCQEAFCSRGNSALKDWRKARLGVSKVVDEFLLPGPKDRDATSAMALRMPWMETVTSGEASLTLMRIMRARTRRWPILDLLEVMRRAQL